MRDRLMALINDVVHPCHAGALADYLSDVDKDKYPLSRQDKRFVEVKDDE